METEEYDDEIEDLIGQHCKPIEDGDDFIEVTLKNALSLAMFLLEEVTSRDHDKYEITTERTENKCIVSHKKLTDTSVYKRSTISELPQSPQEEAIMEVRTEEAYMYQRPYIPLEPSTADFNESLNTGSTENINDPQLNSTSSDVMYAPQHEAEMRLYQKLTWKENDNLKSSPCRKLVRFTTYRTYDVDDESVIFSYSYRPLMKKQKMSMPVRRQSRAVMKVITDKMQDLIIDHENPEKCHKQFLKSTTSNKLKNMDELVTGPDVHFSTMNTKSDRCYTGSKNNNQIQKGQNQHQVQKGQIHHQVQKDEINKQVQKGQIDNQVEKGQNHSKSGHGASKSQVWDSYPTGNNGMTNGMIRNNKTTGSHTNHRKIKQLQKMTDQIGKIVKWMMEKMETKDQKRRATTTAEGQTTLYEGQQKQYKYVHTSASMDTLEANAKSKLIPKPSVNACANEESKLTNKLGTNAEANVETKLITKSDLNEDAKGGSKIEGSKVTYREPMVSKHKVRGQNDDNFQQTHYNVAKTDQAVVKNDEFRDCAYGKQSNRKVTEPESASEWTEKSIVRDVTWKRKCLGSPPTQSTLDKLKHKDRVWRGESSSDNSDNSTATESDESSKSKESSPKSSNLTEFQNYEKWHECTKKRSDNERMLSNLKHEKRQPAYDLEPNFYIKDDKFYTLSGQEICMNFNRNKCHKVKHKFAHVRIYTGAINKTMNKSIKVTSHLQCYNRIKVQNEKSSTDATESDLEACKNENGGSLQADVAILKRKIDDEQTKSETKCQKLV